MDRWTEDSFKDVEIKLIHVEGWAFKKRKLDQILHTINLYNVKKETFNFQIHLTPSTVAKSEEKHLVCPAFSLYFSVLNVTESLRFYLESALSHVHRSPALRGRGVGHPDRDKCPAWFSIQLHLLLLYQRLIIITGSPVVPLCSSVYTRLLLRFTSRTAGRFQEMLLFQSRPKVKVDSVWESVSKSGFYSDTSLLVKQQHVSITQDTNTPNHH